MLFSSGWRKVLPTLLTDWRTDGSGAHTDYNNPATTASIARLRKQDLVTSIRSCLRFARADVIAATKGRGQTLPCLQRITTRSHSVQLAWPIIKTSLTSTPTLTSTIALDIWLPRLQPWAPPPDVPTELIEIHTALRIFSARRPSHVVLGNAIGIPCVATR